MPPEAVKGLNMAATSARITQVLDLLGPLYHFFTQSTWSRRVGDPAINDFVAGNPHEMPLPGFVSALGRWSVPQNKDWYAYKNNEAAPRAIVAASLRERRGMPFEDEDIFLTTG